jgi:putative tryptophan/tyrosine transport system substrate-binding protein
MEGARSPLHDRGSAPAGDAGYRLDTPRSTASRSRPRISSLNCTSTAPRSTASRSRPRISSLNCTSTVAVGPTNTTPRARSTPLHAGVASNRPCSAGSSGATILAAVNRRAFVTGLGAVLAAPVAAHAQQAGRLYRIGVLGNVPITEPYGASLWGAFIQGLRELGYVDGQNISIEYVSSEGKYERLPALAAEFVRRKVDVIVVPADQNALAVKQATSSIPIVMIGDPVGSGLVANLARPGGNITGLSALAGPEIVGKQLELLKATLPQVSRVAILRNPGNPTHPIWLRQAEIAARSLTIQIQTLQARGPDEFERAFKAMTTEGAGAVLILNDGMFSIHTTRIADLAMKSHLPAMGPRNMVEAGAGILMSYGPIGPELFRRLATYVDKILKGAKPADLAIEQPTKFELVINLKTAKALGLTIPPSLLLRADQVIE